MLRHIVLLELSDDATPERLRALKEALCALPDTIDGVEAVTAGSDLGLDEGNASFGLVIDCVDDAAWHAYQQHPSHKQVIADHIKPILTSKSAVQMNLE